MINENESGKVADGTGEGSGSRRKGLHKTHLGRWLTLFRVQSIPISAVIVSMGYLLAAETIILREIFGLVAVAAIAHAGINAQNDVLDYETDLVNKKNDKPLIGGRITMKRALLVSSLLIGFSIALSSAVFTSTFLFFLIAIICAIVYNIVSSTHWWSPFAFGAWGMSFSMFGAVTASSQITIEEILLASSFGIFMGSLIILGNVIDAEADENTIHKIFGGQIIREDGSIYHKPGDSINELYIMIPFALWTSILVTQNLRYTGMDAGPLIIVALMSFAAYKAVKITGDLIKLGDEIKRDFLVYIITVSASLLVVYSPLIGIGEMFVLFSASLLWALLSMKVLYGKFLYFP